MTTGFFTPFPKYLQIRELLLRRLASDYRPGDRFPTEHALVDEFGVSRETVREALAGLEREGIVSRHRGKGTFVERLPDDQPDGRLTGPVEDFTELKFDTDAVTLDTGVAKVPLGMVPRLDAAEGETFYLIRRLRRLDGRPLAVHDAFLPIDIGSRVARIDLSHSTIMRELEETLGIPIREVWQQIDAVAADTEMASLLGVSIGAPLLCVRRLFRDDDDRPVVLFIAHFRADRYYYTVGVDGPARRRAVHARRKPAKKVRP